MASSLAAGQETFWRKLPFVFLVSFAVHGKAGQGEECE